MRKLERYIVAIICIMLVSVRTVNAMIPVSDFGEIIPGYAQVVQATQSLGQIKSQLTQMQDTLKAIGDKVKTLSQFGQSLRKFASEIQRVADEATKTINSNLGTNISVNTGLNSIVDKVDSAQNLITDNLVSNINNQINNVNNLVDSTTNMANDLTNKVQTVTDAGKNLETIVDETKKSLMDSTNKNVLDNVKNISNTMSQATADANKSIADIGKTGLVNTTSLQNNIDSINQKAKEIGTLSTNGLETLSTETTTEVLDKINQKQEEIKDKVQQTNKVLDEVDELGVVKTSSVRSSLETISKGCDSISSTLTTSKNSLPKNKGKVIEEEEEEVIEEIDEDNDELSQKIEEIFNQTEREMEQISTQMLDSFNTSLYTLNKGSEANKFALNKLEKTLNLTTNTMKPEDTEKFNDRLQKIKTEEQKLSDKNVEIIESMQEDYKIEYKEKVKDSIENYKKVVKAYLDGTETKEEVKKAGEKLKKTVSTIDIKPDPDAFIKIEENIKKIQKETEELSDDIKNSMKKEGATD